MLMEGGRRGVGEEDVEEKDDEDRRGQEEVG